MVAKDAIRQLGLPDKPVCIHASLRSFGQPVNGLLDAFLDSNCTVLVPSFTDMFEAPPVPRWMPEQNGAGDYSYFYQKSYCNCGCYIPATNALTIEEIGTFPKLVLEHPDRVRGHHCLNSFTALGANAQVLVQAQTNQDVYAPLQKLYELDGYVLLIGTDLRTATAIHYAETLAGRKPFIRWARDTEGETIPVRAGGCSEGFERLAPLLVPYEQQVTVGRSLWRCWRVRDLVDVCVKAIQANPTITHCGDPDCDRCNDAVKGGPL